MRRETREVAKKKRAAFTCTANSYKFARTLLDTERPGMLETPLKEVERYLHNNHSDPNREDALGDCDRIEPVKAPEMRLYVSSGQRNQTPNQGRFGEANDVVRKTRTDSAILYKVYKMCPLLSNNYGGS